MRLWTPEMVEEIRKANEAKVYRAKADGRTRGFNSFSEYCSKVWGIKRSFAYALLSGRRTPKINIGASLRWEVWELDDFRCVYCGVRRFLSVDHIIPESSGGQKNIPNLITCCMTCNTKKGRKLGIFPSEKYMTAARKKIYSPQ